MALAKLRPATPPVPDICPFLLSDRWGASNPNLNLNINLIPYPNPSLKPYRNPNLNINLIP
jgi:hypothetical protein